MLTQPTPGARARHPARARRPLPDPHPRRETALRRHRAPDRPGHLGGGLAGLFAQGTAALSRRCFARTRSNGRTWRSSKGSSSPREARSTCPWWPTGGTGVAGRRARRPTDTPAITHYEVIEQFGGTAAQLDCRLETGRTHQIRIHLAEVGHPVVGEPVYRSRTAPPVSRAVPAPGAPRPGPGFVHPMTGQALRSRPPCPTIWPT